MNRLELAPALKRTPVFGLGCVAGASAIARAADYLRAYPDQSAALVSVELCSLTFQREDAALANVISSGLFGDGAAAVVLAGAEQSRRPAWSAASPPSTTWQLHRRALHGNALLRHLSGARR
jgi:alkylresorcinol/alkylpyrone synthase